MKTLKELAVELVERKNDAETVRVALIEAMKREGLKLFEYEDGKYVRLIEQHIRDTISFPRVVTRSDIENRVIKGSLRDNFDDVMDRRNVE